MVGTFPLILPVKSDRFFACNSGPIHEISLSVEHFLRDFFLLHELVIQMVEEPALACEQALGHGVCLFVFFFFWGGGGGEGGGGEGRERNESLQRCLRNLNVSVEKVCGKC